MLSWLLINIIFSLLALMFIVCNASAPHRMRFLVGFTAMISWLLPWQYVTEFLSSLQWGRLEGLRSSLGAISQVEDIAVFLAAGELNAGAGLSPGELMAVLLTIFTAVGLAGYLFSVYKQQDILRNIERHSEPGDYLWDRIHVPKNAPIRIQRIINGAFTSGCLAPTIWIHEQLIESPELPAVILHESTHIKHHDNAYLLLVTFVEKLFWWNPLIRILAARTRDLQELSCDEYCTHQLCDYRTMLASLIMGSFYRETSFEHEGLSANMFKTFNSDVERIKLMGRSYSMKARHIFSAVAGTLVALTTLGLMAAEEQHAFGAMGAIAVTDEVVHSGEQRLIIVRKLEADPVVTEPALSGLNVKRVMVPVKDGLEGESRLVLIKDQDSDEMLYSFDFNEQSLVSILNSLSRTQDLSRFQKVRAVPAGTDVTSMGPQALKKMLDLDSKLVVEDNAANEIIISVHGDQLNMEESLDLIAEASGCNIFQDGESIVVDWCG